MSDANKKTAVLEEELRKLMILALEGNSVAYEEFLLRVSRMLKKFMGSFSGIGGVGISSLDRANGRVDDMVQEVLLTIHRKRDLYRKDMPILPWIRTIARHRMIDMIRADARRPQTTEWSDLEESFGLMAPVSSSSGEESAQELEALTLGLSEKQKEILFLAKIEEVPLARIAEQRGMSLSAVKVTVHRALQAIRKGKNDIRK
jgi:RNA polymerase sigma-70 factor (ECF subfamily)